MDIFSSLIAEADAALTRGPYSVIDKTTLPPSGEIRDYFHPAPYYWPNPDTPDGLPYVVRQGVRAPGTHLYEPDSDRFDRTRLQRMFDDSRILTLAWTATGRRDYLDHAKAVLIRFFVDPKARMTRHLKFAQVRMGHNDNFGSPAGLIEMKDLYFFFGAARTLIDANCLTDRDQIELRSWFESYINWLIKSKQGVAECATQNNHGVYYDLQVAAIADFLDDQQEFRRALDRAASRMGQHFALDGPQPLELPRPNSLHFCCFNLQGWFNIFCCFNLQGWFNIAALGKRRGYDLWNHRASNGATLRAAAEWLLSFSPRTWPAHQNEAFDRDRLAPIWFEAMANGAGPPPLDPHVDKAQVKPVFYPHDGVKPFWQL